MLELYRNIRRYRIFAELSQAELARRTGYTDRSSIAKIERGDVDLPQSKILAFAKALNVSPGELMGDVERIENPSLGISTDEKKILELYRKLNTEGQQKAQAYLEDLAGLQKYTEPLIKENSAS